MEASTKLSKWFTVGELSCRCGCGICNIDPRLLVKLDKLRDILDRPVSINSGARCRKHNAATKGKPNSQHISTASRTCLAVDIHAPLDQERYEIVKAAMDLNFSGIGVDGSFVHVDLKPGLPRLWVY